jgi:dienelactone hydrolase
MNDLNHPDPARRKAAIIALGRSRERDALPTLKNIVQNDPVPELRGLAVQAVRHIQALHDPLGLDDEEGIQTGSIPHGWRTRPPRRYRVYLLVIVLIAALLVNNNPFYDDPDSFDQWRRMQGDTGYYLIIPEQIPPDSGWSLLVALHYHEEALPFWREPAQKAGVIVVVPDFADDQRPAEQTLALHRILEAVRQTYPVDRVVLFGFSEGGELATLYAREYGQVTAVSAAAPTDIHLPAAADTTTRYLIAYGDQDALLESNRARVRDFQERANPAEFLIIEGIGHELIPQHLQWTLGLFE